MHKAQLGSLLQVVITYIFKVYFYNSIHISFPSIPLLLFLKQYNYQSHESSNHHHYNSHSSYNRGSIKLASALTYLVRKTANPAVVFQSVNFTVKEQYVNPYCQVGEEKRSIQAFTLQFSDTLTVYDKSGNLNAAPLDFCVVHKMDPRYQRCPRESDEVGYSLGLKNEMGHFVVRDIPKPFNNRICIQLTPCEMAEASIYFNKNHNRVKGGWRETNYMYYDFDFRHQGGTLEKQLRVEREATRLHSVYVLYGNETADITTELPGSVSVVRHNAGYCVDKPDNCIVHVEGLKLTERRYLLYKMDGTKPLCIDQSEANRDMKLSLVDYFKNPYETKFGLYERIPIRRIWSQPIKVAPTTTTTTTSTATTKYINKNDNDAKSGAFNDPLLDEKEFDFSNNDDGESGETRSEKTLKRFSKDQCLEGGSWSQAKFIFN